MRSIFRVVQLAIILVAVALAYSYRDAVKEAYDDATSYVRRVNKEMGIEFAYPPSPSSTVAAAPTPSTEVTAHAPAQGQTETPQGQPTGSAPVLASETRSQTQIAIAANPQAQPPAATSAPPAASLDSMLAQARRAARARQHEQAVQAYLTITQRYPDSYDAFGELGNLYYAHGRHGEAAASYYQAALRLLQAGYVCEAEHLQGLIGPLNQPLATSLETKLMLSRMKGR